MSSVIPQRKSACAPGEAEARILVLAPIGRDGPLTVQAFATAGIPACLCHNLPELCEEIERGAAGALLTGEALAESNRERLEALIQRQPAWSDLPILLLAGGSERALLEILVLPLGNVTIMERPLSLPSLLSAVRAALRARERQYQVRELLQQTEKARLVAEQHQEHIQTLNLQLNRAMRETHHRVKNNLQVVASLVDMQITENQHTVPVEEMVRLRMHVRMLAAVHDLLTHQAKEDGQAHFLSAEDLLMKLLSLMQQTAPQFDFHYSVDDALLSARQGTSLAIVANELISNSIKYGRTKISIRFFVTDGQAGMEVCDDGPGFPEDFDPSTAAHTGLDLVDSLIRWDLGGSVRYTTLPEGGGCVTVTMPYVKPC